MMMKLLGMLAAFALLATSLVAGQEQPESRQKSIQLGADMSVITPTLLDIGRQTSFFLSVADQIGFDSEQTRALEDLFFDARVLRMRSAADLDVEEAELRRLLTRDEIDLEAVRFRLERVGAIELELKMHQIESLLKAIQVLTHKQHLALVTQALE